MNKRVIDKIFLILEERDMTPHSFAVKYGMNATTVNDILTQRSEPKQVTIEKIAECLGVSMEELYRDDSKDKHVASKELDIVARLNNYDEHKRGRVVGYMDRLDEE